MDSSTKLFNVNVINASTTCDTKYHKQRSAITSLHLNNHVAWVCFNFQHVKSFVFAKSSWHGRGVLVIMNQIEYIYIEYPIYRTHNKVR